MYYECPADRPILAGSCSGGANPDCNGHYFATQCCPENSKVFDVTGHWVQEGHISSGTQTLSYQHGTSHTVTQGTTSSIAKAISAKVSIGAKFAGIGVSGEISSSVTRTLSVMDSQAWGETFTDTYSTTLAAGVVWQWQWNTRFVRGDAVSKTNALVSTNGVTLPPCCFPGYAVDPTNYRGSCNGGVDLCGRATNSSLTLV